MTTVTTPTSEATEATPKLDPKAVKAAGAVGKWDETFGTTTERTYGALVSAANEAIDAIRPFFTAQRTAWAKANDRRDPKNYNADSFATALMGMSEINLPAGSQDRKRFDMLFVCLQHGHNATTVKRYRNYCLAEAIAGQTWDGYITWLPTAERYNASGTLTQEAIDADAKSDADRLTTSAKLWNVRLEAQIDWTTMVPENCEDDLAFFLRVESDLHGYVESRLAAVAAADGNDDNVKARRRAVRKARDAAVK